MTKFIKNTVDVFGLIGFVVAAAILILLSGGGYFLFKAYLPGEFSVACTQEAKQCPDGSYVGRTGSNCEFAECPVSCEECDRIIVGKCEPDFVVEKGPELTASEAYSEECTSKASKAACEQVDIFNKAKGTFGNTDGTPDCKWVESAEIIDTSTWKTYRNEKYGFEFKYPVSWTKSGAWNADPDSMPYLLNEGVMDPSNQFRSLHIYIFDKKYLIMLDIADQGFDFSSDTLRAGDQFFAKKNDFVIQLYFSSEKPDSELADQILSTFKFIEK